VPLPKPVLGLVVHYSYLWHDEKQRGLEEGVKDRPCVIVSAVVAIEGDTVIIVAPITHRPPPSANQAVELPITTKRRLGMDDQRSWIVVDDLNRFRWPGPDLRPVSGRGAGVYDYGFLPPRLFQTVKQAIADAAHQKRVSPTTR
jgi:hypothetical protein